MIYNNNYIIFRCKAWRKNPEPGLNLVLKMLKTTQIRRAYVIDMRKIIAKVRPKWLIQDNKD